MKHFKTLIAALLILWLTYPSVYAKPGDRTVTIINNDKYKKYVCVLCEHTNHAYTADA